MLTNSLSLPKIEASNYHSEDLASKNEPNSYFLVEETLKEQQLEMEQNSHPLTYFVRRDLCPKQVLLRNSSQILVDIKHCETYFRSEDNPFTQYIKNSQLTDYQKDKKLKFGWKANIGNYVNFMHAIEKEGFKVDKANKILTSKGDGSLYDKSLRTKNFICGYIAKSMSDTQCIKVGYYNEYSCLMVYVIPDKIILKNKDLQTRGKKFYAWVNIIISYFVALVNYNCYESKLPIELERRSGFGFFTPTIADADNSFRINTGITPIVFADILIKCLKILDNSLQNIYSNPSKITIDSIFYGSDAHLKYLEKKLYRVGLYKNQENKKYNILYYTDENKVFYKVESGIIDIADKSKLLARRSNKEVYELKDPLKPIQSNIDELAQFQPEYLEAILPNCIASIDNKKVDVASPTDWLEFLWTPVDKGGGTTLENIAKTSYARHMLSNYIFLSLVKKSPTNISDFNSIFISSIEKIIKKFYITKDYKTLSLDQSEPIINKKNFSSELFKIEDDKFWEIINQIILMLEKTSFKDQIQVCIDNIKAYYNLKMIDNNFYAVFEALNELIFIAAIKRTNDLDQKYGDGYASDSDVEDEVQDRELNQKKIYAKKIVAHNGMRAIVLAVLAIQELDPYNIKNIWLDKTYYEVPFGIEVLESLKKLSLTITKIPSEAAILLRDANPCITEQRENNKNDEPFIINDGCKFLVIDVTSATSDKCNEYFKKFENSRAQTLIFVESGAKHQQFFTKNQYGMIRIFSRDKDKRDKIYKKIKEFNEPILSKTSHTFRRFMKEIGMTLTNKKIINPQMDHLT